METNFYIFRHGETDYNAQNRCQGCMCDRSLTRQGIRQAEQLAEKLCDCQLDKIYTSPLQRARHTANIVALWAGLTYPVDEEDLREGNFGVAEGKAEDELGSLLSSLMHEFCHPTPHNWDWKFPGPGSESKHEIFDRAYAALQRIAKASPGQNVGISTHAGVISALACGMDLWDVRYENCAVLHLVYNHQTERFCQIF